MTCGSFALLLRVRLLRRDGDRVMGVPFEALFTQVWHEIFGLATRELALRHMIASAYGDAVRHKGSLSVLWRQSLYSFSPG